MNKHKPCCCVDCVHHEVNDSFNPDPGPYCTLEDCAMEDEDAD